MLRIIDNKKIDLTDSEFALYNEICKSYDRNNFSGKDFYHRTCKFHYIMKFASPMIEIISLERICLKVYLKQMKRV